MKYKQLHLGCGDIYLEGFINCDIDGHFAHEVTDNQLGDNKTTLDQYFKYPFGSPRREIIYDKKMDLLEFPWDFKDNSIEKIVMISCFEHFTEHEALLIVHEMKRILQINGQIIIDVPDLRGTLEQYYNTNPKWAMTLVYCNGKNPFSFHKFGYNIDTFTQLWGNNYVVKPYTVVAHDYPILSFLITKIRGD